MSMAAEGLSWS